MFRFRDKTYAGIDFGHHLVYALRRTAFQAVVHQPKGCQFAVLDEPHSLQAFEQALDAIRLMSRSFYPQYDSLQWALSKSGSMLVAYVRSDIDYLTSGDEYEFEPLLTDPTQLDPFLRDFQGVSSKARRGNLTVVTA